MLSQLLKAETAEREVQSMAHHCHILETGNDSLSLLGLLRGTVFKPEAMPAQPFAGIAYNSVVCNLSSGMYDFA